MKLDDLLLELPMMEKLSVVENPDKQQLEQDFGKLAFAFLKDRAPRLIPYLIGFEIVEAAPDGSRSCGLFGFKVGEGVYYVPVFFMNNQIKGMDSIYSRRDDTFVPLTEPRINTLVTRQTIELGAPGEATSRESFTVPDFSLLVYPPQLGVGGRDSGSVKASAADVMADLKAHFIKMAGQSADMLSSDPEMRAMLAGLICSAQGVAVDRADISTSKLARFIHDVAGPDGVVKIAAAMKDVGFAKALCHFYDHNALLASSYDAKFAPKTAAEAKVKILTCNDNCVSEDQGKKIMTQGFAIDDKRDDKDRTEMFEYKSEQSLSNPTEPGNYDVMMTSGICRCDVYTPNLPSFTRRAIVLVDKDGNWTTAHTRRVFVNGARIDHEDKQTPFDKAKDADGMEVGKQYMLVNKDMKSTFPFKVTSVIKTDGGGDVRYVVDFCDDVMHDLDDDSGGLPEAQYSPTAKAYGVSLYLSPTAGSIRSFADQMVVPKDTWKAVKLSHTCSYGDDGRTLMKAFRPASYGEVAEDLTKVGLCRLQVESRDEGVAYSIRLDNIVDCDNMTYKSACVRLVRDYGLSVDNAETMLKQACSDRKSDRMVKFAQIPMQVTPPQIPPYNDQGYDSIVGVPTQVPQINYTMGDTVVPPPRPSGPGSMANVGGEAQRQQTGWSGGSNTSKGNMGDYPFGPDVNQMAQMASQSGQQQVFDQTVIGGMARTYDTNSIIDSTMPEFSKSLDRLGRLLFLFYWKNEDYQERYGSQDMSTMEDNLRSVYKSFGDLVLKLSQKSISDEDRFFI